VNPLSGEASVAEKTLFAAKGFVHPETDTILYCSPGVDVTTTRSERWRPA